MKNRRNEKGLALLLALVLTTGLIVLGTGFFTSITSNSRLSVKTYTDVEALHIAESGIEYGIWEVSHGGRDFLAADGWSGIGTALDPWVRTDTISISGGPSIGEHVIYVVDVGSNSFQIVSQGFFPSQANSVSDCIVKIVIEEEKLFQQAVFCLDEMTIENNAYIDSYDSSLGLYGGANVGTNADLVTNSISTAVPYAANLKAGSFVDGDITVGPGVDPASAVNFTGGAAISGTLKTLRRTKNPADTPDISGLWPSSGALDVSGGGTVTQTISADAHYDSLNIGNNDELIINGNITLYVDGAFNMNPNAKITLTPGSSVNLFQNGAMTFSPGVIMDNQTQDPKRFTILCTNNVTTVDFKPGAQFYGNVYMPNADFKLDPGTEYFGSIFAKTVEIGNLCVYHFDESLIDDPNAPSLNQYNVLEWQTISQLP